MNSNNHKPIKITVLAPEAENRVHLAEHSFLRVASGLTPKQLSNVQNLFIEISASALPMVSDIVREARAHNFLRGLLIREDIDAKLMPQLLQRANLRLMKNILVHAGSDWVTPIRVIRAWKYGSHNDLFATAYASNDRLYAMNCAMKQHEVAFSDIPALSRIPQTERGNFTIDELGSTIHWVASDTHLSIEDIWYYTDPEYRKKVDRNNIVYAQLFGRSVAAVRDKYGLNKRSIPGLSDRQLRRIENEGVKPSVETLRKLASAHGLTFNEYFEELAPLLRARI